MLPKLPAVIACVGLFAVGLGGCKDEPQPPSTPPVEDPNPAPEPAPQPAPEPAPQPAPAPAPEPAATAEVSCGDGVVCPSYAKCFCDGQGRVVRHDTDIDGNDPRDTIRFEYDAAGRVAREISDVSSDGTPETTVTYTYDAAGHLVRQLVKESPSVGGPDKLRTYTWDEDRLLLVELDARLDGTIERRTRYHYDANGRLVGSDSGKETIAFRCVYSQPCATLPDPAPSPTATLIPCKEQRSCQRVNVPWPAEGR